MKTFVVDFNQPEEFIEELVRHPHVAYGIVRVTNLYRGSSNGLPITRMFVVATALVENQELLLRMEHYAGDLMRLPSDSEAKKRALDAVRAIQDAAESKGLEVRAGIYKLGEPK